MRVASRRVAPRRHRPMLDLLEGRSLLTSASFSVVQDWGSGLTAQISISNTSAAAVPNWKLEFDYTPGITQIWDGTIAGHTGTHYAITGAGWNSTLAGNGTVAFGFNAAPGGGALPTGFKLNGVAIGAGATQPPPLTISVGDASVAEGNSGTTNLVFPIGLSAASATPVTVGYATSNGTATAGSDYTAASGTVTFAPGETSKSITVKVAGDTTPEPDETFSVNLSSPSGAGLARATATGTIKDDDTPPPASSGIPATVTYSVTSDWGSGFNGQIVVKNASAATLSGWTLDFDMAAPISSVWNAALVARTGNHYQVKDAGWNATLAPNGTITIGFGATGSSANKPTNFVLNSGSTSGGSTGGAQAPPVAVNDTAYTSVGLAVGIAVLGNDTDPNNDPLVLASVTQGKNGAVVANADNTVTYTPKAGYAGADSFTYVVSDGRGGTATGTVAITVVTAPATPQRVFNPYVDVGLYPLLDMATVAKTQGVKFFTLAFITASPAGQPAWGGYEEYAVNGGAFDQQMRAQVAGIRGVGGDVTASFGGASGTELAQAITNVTTLKNAYRTVVDAYNLTSIDFDIEGAATADRASVDRRSQAIAALQADLAAAGRTLKVWLTLPVLPTGLTGDGLYVVQSAQKYGVQLAGVNVMAMDYGDSAAPNPACKMGDYAIQSATSTFNQLKTLYGSTRTDPQLWAMVGVTPMIGMNDVTTEIFDQTAARQLLTFAQQKGLGRLAFWSANRDQPAPGGGTANYVGLTFSSVKQTPYEFSNIFKPFTA